MKKNLMTVICFVFVQSVFAQVIKHVPTRPTVVHTVLAVNTATLYQNANFSGQSKAFGIGSYLLHDSTDLIKMSSSITVPAGLVAIIYENADAGGGYGASVDLMEDCPDLSIYNFNDKASYITVFNAKNSSGLIWVRGKLENGQYVAGHWERERANGQNPNGSVAFVAPPIPPRPVDMNDLSKAPIATQAEIDEFNTVLNNQNGVGVLGGENARPFYYHANQPNEVVYKYQKLIDASRLPSGFLQWASDKLSGIAVVGGALSVIPYTGKVIIEFVDEAKDWLFGKESTAEWIDAWYPVNENKITVCGTMAGNASTCSQDYLHTKLTVDKDVNLEIHPDNNFTWALNNRWLKPDEQKNIIDGEVKLKNLINSNTGTNETNETVIPHNPLLMQIQNENNVCMYGPWMADILDINGKVPIPFTDDKIDLGKIDINTNNEIHPVNQVWYKKGDEIQLIAIADGNGYFDKTGNNEIEASGLNHRMSFYIAFQIPNSRNTATTGISSYEYDINGIGFDFTNNPAENIQPKTLSLKYNGVERIKINDNSSIKLQKTHEILFDKIRSRSDGSIQGYIIVQTEPIVLQGGSINITVNINTHQNGGIVPIHTTDVRQ